MAGALSPRQTFALDEACKVLREAFGKVPYLVGTAADYKERKPYRDVDVRLMLDDDVYDKWSDVIGEKAITFLGFVIGDWLASRTQLPIDFQFQRTTEANEKHNGVRNAFGLRDLENYKGDARPLANSVKELEEVK